MTIDALPTITQLTSDIDKTWVFLAPAGSWIDGQNSKFYHRAPPAPVEIVDAQSLLASLQTASSVYLEKWNAWLGTYQPAFQLLDRRARYVLSLTTTTPPAITFAEDQATHDLLVTRANTAAASGAPAAALTELARLRTSFDGAWTAQSTTVGPATALTAAIAAGQQSIAYLAWVRTGP